MSNSNWLSVFGRDYYNTAALCDYSGESLNLDGIDQAVAMNSATHWPQIHANGGATTQHFISMWVRSDYTSATAGLRFLATQSAGSFGAGVSNNQFFRLGYQMTDGGGVPKNLMYVTYRDDTIGGNNNQIERIFTLNGANNTAITGATNTTDYWFANNTTATGGNITTNSNEFVHLCVALTLPSIGGNYSTGGSIDLYWNGQQLIDNSNYSRTGVGVNSSNSVYSTVGCNIVNLQNFWFGQIDEIGALQEFLTLGPFKTAYGLSSTQDVVDKLYNSGCPGDVTSTASAPTANQWNYHFYRFESPNQWLNESGGGVIAPQNGATTTTIYHA